MCGRFRIARKKEILEEAFEAADCWGGTDWVPRYNVAPGQEIAVVRETDSKSGRSLSSMRWGMVPSWAKDASIGPKLINATKPAFREPLRFRRCLVPVDGFYEWKRDGRKKLPLCFMLSDNSVFAMAGIWEQWRSPQGGFIESCSILTTIPNELMRDVHDRMPVILPPDAYDKWLDRSFENTGVLQTLLKPYSAELMRRYPVSERVNHVKNDDAECAEESLSPYLCGYLWEQATEN
jgi:putative SOS response-associated peptidase YedK